jgi:hypothetical protein
MGCRYSQLPVSLIDEIFFALTTVMKDMNEQEVANTVYSLVNYKILQYLILYICNYFIFH